MSPSSSLLFSPLSPVLSSPLLIPPLQDPLVGGLQLVDLTQAPLLNSQEDLKKKEVEITAGLDLLHKEYQSVKTLLDRCTA